MKREMFLVVVRIFLRIKVYVDLVDVLIEVCDWVFVFSTSIVKYMVIVFFFL